MKFLKIKEELHYLKQKYAVMRELEQMVTDEEYLLIEPAFFEDYDAFIRTNKRIKKESMVKVLNGDGSVFILRHDATTSIIKHVLPKWEDGLNLRLFYHTTVFSVKPHSNLNETGQFGVEYLGVGANEADLKIIQLVSKLLKRFNEVFIIKIGNSEFLNSFITSLNLEPIVEQELKDAIFYKNQFEIEKIIERGKIPSESEPLLIKLLSLQGNLTDIERMLEGVTLTTKMSHALRHLRTLHQQMDVTTVKKVHFDLAMLSKYDYYSGITIMGFYPNVPKPILSGGRYDYLPKQLGYDVPAIGFTINSDELIKEVMRHYE